MSMSVSRRHRRAIKAHFARLYPVLSLLDTDESEAIKQGRMIGPSPLETGDVLSNRAVLAGLHKARLYLQPGAHPVTDEQRQRSREWLAGHGFDVPEPTFLPCRSQS